MSAVARGVARISEVIGRDERDAAFARSAAILALEGLAAPPGWEQVRAEMIDGTREIGEAIFGVTGERRGLSHLRRQGAGGADPHVDPVTKVPYNKLGLRDRAELGAADYRLADMRLAQLMLEPIRGLYDLDHLQRLHRHIHADLHPWAGEYRTGNFSRGIPSEPGWKARFAPVEQIVDVAAAMGEDLGIWNTLNGLGHPEFLARLTAIYIKLNYMHPFVKGNGRAIAAMLSQLAHEARYELRFEDVEAVAWSRATAYTMARVAYAPGLPKPPRDNRPIHEIFARIAVPMGNLD